MVLVLSVLVLVVFVLQNLAENIYEFDGFARYNGIFKMVRVNLKLQLERLTERETDSPTDRQTIALYGGLQKVVSLFVLYEYEL